MGKIKFQMIIFLALLLIGALLWFYPYLKRKGFIKEFVSESAAKGYEIVGVKEPNYTEDFFSAQNRIEEKRPKLSWTRNPFVLPSSETPETELGVSGLLLSGIAVDEIGRIAIINDEIVREGDNIFGIKIIKISEDSVIVEKEGKDYTLKIY